MPEIATMQHDLHDRQANVIGLRISNTTTESSERHTNWNAVRRDAFRQVVLPDGSHRLARSRSSPREYISDGHWETSTGYGLLEESSLAKPTKKPGVAYSIIDFQDLLLSFSDITHVRQIEEIGTGITRGEVHTSVVKLLWHYCAPCTQEESRYRWLFDILSHTIPDDAREFVDRHGLWHHLDLAHSKAIEFFPKPRNIKTVLVADPESDESWLSVRFVTEGSLDDIIAARKKYRQFWVRNVPVTKRLMIRLMYDID